MTKKNVVLLLLAMTIAGVEAKIIQNGIWLINNKPHQSAEGLRELAQEEEHGMTASMTALGVYAGNRPDLKELTQNIATYIDNVRNGNVPVNDLVVRKMVDQLIAKYEPESVEKLTEDLNVLVEDIRLAQAAARPGRRVTNGIWIISGQGGPEFDNETIIANDTVWEAVGLFDLHNFDVNKVVRGIEKYIAAVRAGSIPTNVDSVKSVKELLRKTYPAKFQEILDTLKKDSLDQLVADVESAERG